MSSRYADPVANESLSRTLGTDSLPLQRKRLQNALAQGRVELRLIGGPQCR